jgi:hypothetical protein
MKRIVAALVLCGYSISALASECVRVVSNLPDQVAPVEQKAAQRAGSLYRDAHAHRSCFLDYDAWQQLDVRSRAVWDVRNATVRQRRPVPGALPMSHAAVGTALVPYGQAILIVGDAIDPETSEPTCRALRSRAVEAYVLTGGDRSWRAKYSKLVDYQSLRDSELSASEASTWLNDELTTWIDLAVDGAAPRDARPKSPRRESLDSIRLSGLLKSERRYIYSLPDDTSNTEAARLLADLRDQFNVWWVRASRSTLELAAGKSTNIAMSRSQTLTKPCGVN